MKHLTLLFKGILGGLLLSLGSAAAQAVPPSIDIMRFGDLPAMEQAGSIELPAEYGGERSWNVGQPPAELLTLGDIEAANAPSYLSLAAIAAPQGYDAEHLDITSISLLREQRLMDIAIALPQLQQFKIADLGPVDERLRQAGYDLSHYRFSDVLAFPELANLQLATISAGQYPVASIPGLATVPLGQLSGWESATIASIPGLATLPFGAFPRIPRVPGIVAPVDLVLGSAEAEIDTTISGSYAQGFNVPCYRPCAHIELGGVVAGQRWISGVDQTVRGGHGVLGALHPYEPTGIHPFGPIAKVVLMAVDEASGTAQTALYHRICIKTAFVDLGCTAYFIGPTPWFFLKEGDWVAL